MKIQYNEAKHQKCIISLKKRKEKKNSKGWEVMRFLTSKT